MAYQETELLAVERNTSSYQTLPDLSDLAAYKGTLTEACNLFPVTLEKSLKAKTDSYVLHVLKLEANLIGQLKRPKDLPWFWQWPLPRFSHLVEAPLGIEPGLFSRLFKAYQHWQNEGREDRIICASRLRVLRVLYLAGKTIPSDLEVASTYKVLYDDLRKEELQQVFLEQQWDKEWQRLEDPTASSLGIIERFKAWYFTPEDQAKLPTQFIDCYRVAKWYQPQPDTPYYNHMDEIIAEPLHQLQKALANDNPEPRSWWENFKYLLPSALVAVSSVTLALRIGNLVGFGLASACFIVNIFQANEGWKFIRSKFEPHLQVVEQHKNLSPFWQIIWFLTKSVALIFAFLSPFMLLFENISATKNADVEGVIKVIWSILMVGSSISIIPLEYYGLMGGLLITLAFLMNIITRCFSAGDVWLHERAQKTVAEQFHVSWGKLLRSGMQDADIPKVVITELKGLLEEGALEEVMRLLGYMDINRLENNSEVCQLIFNALQENSPSTFVRALKFFAKVLVPLGALPGIRYLYGSNFVEGGVDYGVSKPVMHVISFPGLAINVFLTIVFVKDFYAVFDIFDKHRLPDLMQYLDPKLKRYGLYPTNTVLTLGSSATLGSLANSIPVFASIEDFIIIVNGPPTNDNLKKIYELYKFNQGNTHVCELIELKDAITSLQTVFLKMKQEHFKEALRGKFSLILLQILYQSNQFSNEELRTLFKDVACADEFLNGKEQAANTDMNTGGVNNTETILGALQQTDGNFPRRGPFGYNQRTLEENEQYKNVLNFQRQDQKEKTHQATTASRFAGSFPLQAV